MKEADFMRRCMKRASDLGARLFRNNTGQAWAGKATRLKDGSVLIENARPFHGGLCVGSSDLIGWTPVKITPEMVGKTIAVFTAVETKTARGRATTEQLNFIRVLNSHGGYGGIAREDGDLERILSTGLASTD